MRIVRFELPGRSGYGILEGEKIAVLWGTPYEDGLKNTIGEIMSLPEVKLAGPLRAQQNRGPGAELPGPRPGVRHPLPDEPLLFMKPSTAVIGPDDDIVYPAMSRRVDYEASWPW